MMNQPSLCEIWTSMDKGSPMLAAEKVEVRVEGGILGDRYETGNGAFSRWPGTGRALTLITKEDILWMRENHGLDLTKGEHRRNLVIQGVTLEELKGRTFQIGQVRVQAVRDCAPCAYLQTLLAVDVMKIMNGRGGLRLDVLTGVKFPWVISFLGILANVGFCPEVAMECRLSKWSFLARLWP